VCDFINVVKVCQLEFYWLYYDPYIKFGDLIFYEFNVLWSFIHKNLPMNRCAYLNGEEPNYLVIEFASFKFVVNHYCFTSFWKLVLRSNFPLVMAHVKSSCENSTKALVDELQGRFPNHELMLTLGVIHPKFWAQNLDNFGDDFH